MEQEMTKPFKTVTTEYFEEIDYDTTGADRRKDFLPVNRQSRRIRVVTTTEEYCGSRHDPVVSRVYTYL